MLKPYVFQWSKKHIKPNCPPVVPMGVRYFAAQAAAHALQLEIQEVCLRVGGIRGCQAEDFVLAAQVFSPGWYSREVEGPEQPR